MQKERSARSCETVGTVDIMAEEARSRPLPHYMQTTGAQAERMEAKATVIGNVRGPATGHRASHSHRLRERLHLTFVWPHMLRAAIPSLTAAATFARCVGCAVTVPLQYRYICQVRGLRELRERNRFEAEEEERRQRVSQVNR